MLLELSVGVVVARRVAAGDDREAAHAAYPNQRSGADVEPTSATYESRFPGASSNINYIRANNQNSFARATKLLGDPDAYTGFATCFDRTPGTESAQPLGVAFPNPHGGEHPLVMMFADDSERTCVALEWVRKFGLYSPLGDIQYIKIKEVLEESVQEMSGEMAAALPDGASKTAVSVTSLPFADGKTPVIAAPPAYHIDALLHGEEAMRSRLASAMIGVLRQRNEQFLADAPSDGSNGGGAADAAAGDALTPLLPASAPGSAASSGDAPDDGRCGAVVEVARDGVATTYQFCDRAVGHAGMCRPFNWRDHVDAARFVDDAAHAAGPLFPPHAGTPLNLASPFTVYPSADSHESAATCDAGADYHFELWINDHITADGMTHQIEWDDDGLVPDIAQMCRGATDHLENFVAGVFNTIADQPLHIIDCERGSGEHLTRYVLGVVSIQVIPNAGTTDLPQYLRSRGGMLCFDGSDPELDRARQNYID
eukprot:gene5284-4232_t